MLVSLGSSVNFVVVVLCIVSVCIMMTHEGNPSIVVLDMHDSFTTLSSLSHISYMVARPTARLTSNFQTLSASCLPFA